MIQGVLEGMLWQSQGGTPLGASGWHTTGFLRATGDIKRYTTVGIDGHTTEEFRGNSFRGLMQSSASYCADLTVLVLPLAALLSRPSHMMSSISALDGLKRRAGGDQHYTLCG